MVLDVFRIGSAFATSTSYHVTMFVERRSRLGSFSFVFPLPLDQPVAMLEAGGSVQNVEISEHIRSNNDVTGRLRSLPRLPLLPDSLVLLLLTSARC